MINVTPSAAAKISELLTEENKSSAGLRVFVQGGGCSGFQYGLMIDEGEGDATTDAVIESNGVQAARRSDQRALSQRRRSRFRRQRHRRRLHDQEPEREVDLRLRVVVLRLARSTVTDGPAAVHVGAVRSVARTAHRAIENPPPLSSKACGPPAASGPSKRDLIVNVFLRQEGHLTADDLVDLIRQEDQRISRATVYRTLQWMVEAGIARKVDFGEGRFRFEHSYRHPRHFHLICKTCNRSFEFLSSDIETLIEEVAAARRFARAAERRCRSTGRATRAGPGAPPLAEGGVDRAAVRARRAADRHCDRAQRTRLLLARRAR